MGYGHRRAKQLGGDGIVFPKADSAVRGNGGAKPVTFYVIRMNCRELSPFHSKAALSLVSGCCWIMKASKTAANKSSS